ncbi:MAG: hypothetical protein RI947_43 [Candidatus Parcubacteria bacterium]|jgi:Gpi18-like mannosyltransferase
MQTVKLSETRNIVIIIAIVFISAMLLYWPYLLRTSPFGLDLHTPDMNVIYSNYDGPLYIIPAKTLYNPAAIEKIGLETPLPTKYFAAHFPLYPALIRLFSFVGYLKSMILVSFLGSVLLGIGFYYVVKKLSLSQSPLLLTTVMLFLPRLLVVRAVGAPETFFMLFIILSLYFFEQKKYALAGILGALATMTKAPGVLLFIVYVLAIGEQYMKSRKVRWQWLYVLLIPVGLLSVFGLYSLQYHDFFAFWHTGGVVPLVYPFAAFNFQKQWIGTGWLEDVVFYFYLYILSAVTLRDSKYRSFFYFSVVFLVATSFVQHRDIARYALPLWPVACIAFEKFLVSRKYFWALVIALPAIYLYAWNFLSYNTMPISNWAPFL